MQHEFQFFCSQCGNVIAIHDEQGDVACSSCGCVFHYGIVKGLSYEIHVSTILLEI